MAQWHNFNEKSYSYGLSKTYVFGEGVLPQVWQLIMFQECLSDVKTPNIGEMQGMHLNLARRGSNKNEINGKLLKAPKIVIS